MKFLYLFRLSLLLTLFIFITYQSQWITSTVIKTIVKISAFLDLFYDLFGGKLVVSLTLVITLERLLVEHLEYESIGGLTIEDKIHWPCHQPELVNMDFCSGGPRLFQIKIIYSLRTPCEKYGCIRSVDCEGNNFSTQDLSFIMIIIIVIIIIFFYGENYSLQDPSLPKQRQLI